MSAPNEKVVIELSGQEALIVFELLYRWDKTNKMSITLEHQAEQRVLWNMLAKLESKLAEPFLPNYMDLLNQAREAVQDRPE